MAKKFTKVLCALLAFVMCLGTVPAFAIETTETFIPQPPKEVGNNYPISKKLNNFKNDIANITLRVPADDISLGVDIVYIAGAYLEQSEVESDLMIDSLYWTFYEAIDAGVPVNFGFVPFSYDDKPVMDLNEHKYDTIEKLEADFRNDLKEAIGKASKAYGGENMENALQIAKKMFAASDLADHPERQHLVLVSSGHTYNFNVGENNEIFSTVPVAIAGSEKAGKYFYGFKAWMQARNKNPNNYPIPKPFSKNNDYRDWDAYWEVIDQWAKADIAAGDKVVYNILDTTDYSFGYYDWYSLAYCGQDANHNAVTTFKSYGAYIHTATELALKNGYDFANAPQSAHGSMLGTTIDNIPAAAQHAISYERAMWEASNFIDNEITGTGINFYSIYNQMKPEYTNGVYADGTVNADGTIYKHNVTWTQQYIGHSFMDMLARNAGMEEAINNSTATDKAFFDPIKAKILYSISNGSKVTDAIGYDATEGNFDFITDADKITLVFNDVEYKTIMTSSTVNADGKIIKASYKFVLHEIWMENDPLFTLDYYYGDGMEGEYFDWNFHTDVSVKDRVSLTYNLELVEKSSEIGTHTLDTNRFAVLYPVDSDGKAGIPHLFPVPFVEYEVNPYDVDIVLALGAGIAQYQNTYESIVSLVKPLIEQGINVKLGFVAVEHYTEKAMDLTVLTADNYTDVITGGLNTIKSMPAGPTNLEGVIAEAHAMLTAESEAHIPAANKFFYVIATGRTYCFDDAEGNPATTLNSVSLKGKTYYYWGHYAWQSQRGRHTSLYLLPNGNNWDAYWEDVVAMNEADAGKYDYTMPGDYSDPDWYVGTEGFFTNNTADAKAKGLASSRFGWIINDLTNSGLDAIGSGANPGHAMAYDRGQYEGWVAYTAMQDAGINCYAICSENTSYQNGSPYIQVAGYKGNTTMQVGHSFMNFLAGGEATLLFQLTDPNTGASEMVKDFFNEANAIDITKLVKTDAQALGSSTLSLRNSAAKNAVASVSVDAEGDALTYKWYYKNQGSDEFTLSSFTGADFRAVMSSDYDGMQVYCVITDQYGNSTTTEVVTLNLD